MKKERVKKLSFIHAFYVYTLDFSYQDKHTNTPTLDYTLDFVPTTTLDSATTLDHTLDFVPTTTLDFVPLEHYRIPTHSTYTHTRFLVSRPIKKLSGLMSR